MNISTLKLLLIVLSKLLTIVGGQLYKYVTFCLPGFVPEHNFFFIRMSKIDFVISDTQIATEMISKHLADLYVKYEIIKT